jgi:hypothetical protein
MPYFDDAGTKPHGDVKSLTGNHRSVFRQSQIYKSAVFVEGIDSTSLLIGRGWAGFLIVSGHPEEQPERGEEQCYNDRPERASSSLSHDHASLLLSQKVGRWARAGRASSCARTLRLRSGQASREPALSLSKGRLSPHKPLIGQRLRANCQSRNAPAAKAPRPSPARVMDERTSARLWLTRLDSGYGPTAGPSTAPSLALRLRSE